MSGSGRVVYRTVRGEVQKTPPIWLLRQAGRYLPEYRAIRANVADFLELCHTPKLAAEVTMQPIRRYDLDAAIVFSDILVVPAAMGQKVRFEAGEGPLLEPLGPDLLKALDGEGARGNLASIFETVKLVRKGLDPEKSLIGFCGSPWTVATYMIGGKGSTDQGLARLFALERPESFGELIDKLVVASADYLVGQLQAGCDVIQLFESWAGNLDEVEFADYVIAPTRRIIDLVRARAPEAAIIGFARGCGPLCVDYVTKTGIDMIGLDHMLPLEYAQAHLPEELGVQGALDPLRLVAGGEQMRRRTGEICAAFAGRPHIFNLGHGIVPQTPPEHVAELVKFVREGK